MAGVSRSRNGCWTCRLRRKKCDEKHPTCLNCDNLGILCHGYGTKPDWMDGGEKEKETAANTRREIKDAARREPVRGLNANQRTSASPSSLPETSTSASSHTLEDIPGGSDQHDSEASNSNFFGETGHSDLIIARPDQDNELAFDCTGISTALPQDNDTERSTQFGLNKGRAISEEAEYNSPQTIRGHEASFLMYYLDYVFPLQFKMYDPTMADGGRGWLLQLLLGTPPIYHVTIALSAYVVEVLQTPHVEEERKRATFAKLGLALQNLQQYVKVFIQRADSASIEETIRVLGCILQMVGFVTFVGGTENWQFHMKGASTIIRPLIDALLSLAVLPAAQVLPVKEDELSLKFLTAVFTWIDVTGACALGCSPFLLDVLPGLLGGDNPPVRMDKVMGCQNWVVIHVANIAALDSWKRKAQASGMLSLVELVTRATKLEKEITRDLNDFLENCKRAEQENPHMNQTPHLTNRISLAIHADYVNEVYASSALTYLHVVVSGAYPELPEIRGNFLKTMAIFKRIPDPVLPRTLLWPFMITGSMALRHEEDFFRNLIATSGSSPSFIGAGWNILRVLEECWKTRGTNVQKPGGDGYWGDIMSSLGMKVIVM